jgi:hypothetical protein
LHVRKFKSVSEFTAIGQEAEVSVIATSPTTSSHQPYNNLNTRNVSNLRNNYEIMPFDLFQFRINFSVNSVFSPYGLGPLTYSNSEIALQTMNLIDSCCVPFDWPIATFLLTQDDCTIQ